MAQPFAVVRLRQESDSVAAVPVILPSEATLQRMIHLLLVVRQQNRDTLQFLTRLEQKTDLLADRFAWNASRLSVPAASPARSCKLPEVASNVMKAIIRILVQLKFSLHGKKGKKAFILTRLWTVATDAITKKEKIDGQ
ncbi:uncharacterized protein LOC144120340 [Amblyomma americanum]